MLRATVFPLLVVARVPCFGGVDEFAAARFGAADGAGGDSLLPVLAWLAVVGVIAAVCGTAAFEVALPLVGMPAVVAAAGWVAGQRGAACAADAEAWALASGHVAHSPLCMRLFRASA
jgi:hypothetical protein